MSSIFRNMATAAIMLVAISSCEEEVLNIGQTITDDNDQLNVNTADYTVSTRTIVADSVLSLATDCYFGRVRDPQTGSDVTSEFTTQFHLLENTYITPEDKIIGQYNGRAAADSCDLILYLENPFRQSDSLVAMKMRVSELIKPLEEGQRYYSNFNPRTSGLLRSNGLVKNHVFSYANQSETDATLTSSTYQPCIRITLNEPYTAPDGTTYKNYGTFIMHQYYDHPELFRNSYTFAHSLCPGFLFEITDGLGFHSKITNIGLRTFYTITSDTAIVTGGLVLAGTSEVLQTTQVTNNRQALLALAAETGHTYLKTPAGLFTEVTLPIDEIMLNHENDSLLAAKLTFQRINNQSDDDHMLNIPQALLFVQEDSLHSYFEDNRVPDNITSYYTAYNNPIPTNSNSYSNKNTYTFNNLSSLITTLWNIKQQGLKTDPDWLAKHPLWNKMVLVPITYTTSTTTSAVTSVSHDMSLTSTRLVGGPQNQGEPIKINIVYAKFK